MITQVISISYAWIVYNTYFILNNLAMVSQSCQRMIFNTIYQIYHIILHIYVII